MRFLALLPLLLLLVACTSDNPGYQGVEGTPDTGTAAGDGAPSVTDGAGAVDTEPAHDTLAPPDGYSCTPGAFIACQSPTVLARCNDDGDGPLLVDCAPHLCNAAHERCNECDPAAKPICVGNNVGYCTPEGLKAIKPCPTGCDGGKCTDCVKKSYNQDADKDGFGDPAIKTEACEKPPGFVENALDCDDGDANAHTGQQQFFTKPTLGKKNFDYNCDGIEEPKSTATLNCKKSQFGGCTGDGWVNAPPTCGQQGGYGKCQPSPIGIKECIVALSFQTQPCR
jgi:hypothetical protein